MTKKKDQQEEQKGISRRTFLAGLGTGATGLIVSGATGGVVGAVAGGVVGHEISKEDPRVEPRIETPLTWVGRNLDACTGCRQCEIACSLTHENVIWPGASRVRVYEFPPSIEIPVLCYQCPDVPCVRECPADALSVDEETLTVAVDSSKCLRITEGTDCRVCADVCPGSTIRMHPSEDVPMFCDLCGGDPECVKVCPTATVTYNGQKSAAALPQDFAEGIAHRYEVKIVEAEGEGPEMTG